MNNFLNHWMNISKIIMININMRPVPLHTILISFLKCTQRQTEKILSNTNQQNYGTTFNKCYKSICCRGEPGLNQGGHRKNSFLNTSSTIIIEQLKIIPDNWKLYQWGYSATKVSSLLKLIIRLNMGYGTIRKFPCCTLQLVQ